MTAIPVRTGVPVWTGVPVRTGDWFERAFRFGRAFRFTGCAARALLPRRALLTGRSARRPPPQYAPRRGLRSVPPPETLLKAASTLSRPPVRGAVSPSHRHRVRAVGFRPRARGVFSLVALRLPARLCPAPVRDIRRWRGTSKSSAFCPAPVRDNVLFSPQHGIAAARQRRFPVRRIFNPRAALVPPRARLFAARPHPRPFP